MTYELERDPEWERHCRWLPAHEEMLLENPLDYRTRAEYLLSVMTSDFPQHVRDRLQYVITITNKLYEEQERTREATARRKNTSPR